MLHFTKGQDENIRCTLSEKIVLGSPFFLFQFTHIIARAVINIAVPTSDDLSYYPDRYNEFKIAAGAFADAPEGLYSYEVFEIVNETDEPGLKPIESGRAYLHVANPHNYEEYRPQTTQAFKVYNGE